MKRIILFTDEELDDMIHGCEIEHRVDGQLMYFMSKEHFAQLADADNVCEAEEHHHSCFGKYYDECGLACMSGSRGLCSECVECQRADPNY